MSWQKTQIAAGSLGSWQVSRIKRGELKVNPGHSLLCPYSNSLAKPLADVHH